MLVLTRVLVVIVLITVLRYWELIPTFVRGPLSTVGFVIVLYLALSIVSVAGLFLRRRWGFYALYALVLYGTMILSLSFVPVPLGFLPLERRWIGMTLLNAAVFVLAALVHRSFRISAERRRHAGEATA
jgi:hypothetical protein